MSAALSIVAVSAGQASETPPTITSHSFGDQHVWHATVSGRNAAGQDVVSLGTMDSMRMDDDHGWCNWSQSFQYNNAAFSNIKRANMEHKC